jgi:hypothetical protein
VHCLRVFRSSAPSDFLPFSRGKRERQVASLSVITVALVHRNGGSAPVAQCHLEGAVRQALSAGTSEETRCRGRSALRGGSHDA